MKPVWCQESTRLRTYSLAHLGQKPEVERVDGVEEEVGAVVPEAAEEDMRGLVPVLLNRGQQKTTLQHLDRLLLTQV
jgi:hypothetical protein